jgi:SAM-dependent methyltransferase
MKYSKKDLESVSHSRLNGLKFIINYLETNEVKGLKVADLSAGSGFVASLWQKAGAQVHAYDKYPEVFTCTTMTCTTMDLNLDLPIESHTYDYVILMETIEHIPDQLHLFAEISRILKPQGKFILTKPNNSNFAGRIANLWTEGERSNMYLPNEKTIVSYDNGKTYLGRFFLLGAQKLRSLTAMSGLNLIEIGANQISNSSVIFGSLLFPYLKLRSFLTMKKLMKHEDEDPQTLKAQHQLNSNTTILFHKHLCVVFQKNN